MPPSQAPPNVGKPPITSFSQQLIRTPGPVLRQCSLAYIHPVSQQSSKPQAKQGKVTTQLNDKATRQPIIELSQLDPSSHRHPLYQSQIESSVYPKVTGAVSPQLSLFTGIQGIKQRHQTGHPTQVLCLPSSCYLLAPRASDRKASLVLKSTTNQDKLQNPTSLSLSRGGKR